MKQSLNIRNTILFILFMSVINMPLLHAANDDWIIGKWQLSYDPHNAKTDWLEFLPNGDAYNTWQNGERIQGLYIVAPDSVKAVFTYKDKDMIMTFHFNDAKDQLKIVTSKTGKESVYTKIK